MWSKRKRSEEMQIKQIKESMATFSFDFLFVKILQLYICEGGGRGSATPPFFWGLNNFLFVLSLLLFLQSLRFSLKIILSKIVPICKMCYVYA